MERKLIAIDLDGTTLNDRSQITNETKETIQRIINQGHIVSIATGRAFRTSAHFYNQLQLNTPMVNFNGAWCHNPADKNWKNGYHKSLQREIALSLTSYKKYSSVNLISAETQNRVYTDRNAHYPYQEASPAEPLKTIPFIAENLTEDPTSVNIFTDGEKSMPYIQDKIIEEYGRNVEVRTWGGPTPTLEIVSTGIQKAMGVERIAESFNIRRENILAFGDEANDFEMIQYAGHGVVMKNGIDELKEISDDITSATNDENGLAQYLASYFKL